MSTVPQPQDLSKSTGFAYSALHTVLCIDAVLLFSSVTFHWLYVGQLCCTEVAPTRELALQIQREANTFCKAGGLHFVVLGSVIVVNLNEFVLSQARQLT